MKNDQSFPSFGHWIRRRRQVLDLTQAELANQVGCATVTISKIEQDTRRPSQEMAESLVRQLGVPETDVALFRKVARGERTADRLPLVTGPMPQSSLPRPFPRHNLPALVDPFVGRDAELVDLERLLIDRTRRLITIIGPGGVGKTRLALAAGDVQVRLRPFHDRNHADEEMTANGPLFADGVFFVSLAPLQSSEQVPASIAEAVGYQLDRDERARTPQKQLIDFLRRKELLLILDNFEHLPDSTLFVRDILEQASGVQILVTSRARLHLRGEQIYALHGLAFPVNDEEEDVTEFPAVQLFLQNARLVHPDFTLKPEDLIHLSRICHVVHGMPLALNLAAGWTAVLPLATIADEIQKSIDFLMTDLHDVPARQRSMRATFEYSWQHLNPSEQLVLTRLSVFRGGFDLLAAVDVAGASVQDLAALTARSLVQVNRELDRYDVHELLRQFAAEKLAQKPESSRELRDRHGAYYTSWLQEQELDLKGEGQQVALAALENDFENARAGWIWCVERANVEYVEQGLNGLMRFYEWHGRYKEGENACSRALALLSANATHSFALRARVLTWLCRFHRVLGEVGETDQLLREGIRLLDSAQSAGLDVRYARASLLQQAADLAALTNIKMALLRYEESLALFRKLDAKWEMANLMLVAGALAIRFGLVEKGYGLYGESHAIFEELGDQRGLAEALTKMAIVTNRSWELGRSVDYLVQSIEILEDLGDQASLVIGLYVMGYATSFTGRFDKALVYTERSLDISAKLGNPGRIIEATTSTAHALLNLGEYEQAVDHCRSALEWAQEIGDSHLIGWTSYTLGQALLGSGSFDEAEQTTRDAVTTCRQAGDRVNVAFNLTWLAYTAQKTGKTRLAFQYLGEALQIAADLQYREFELITLSTTAFLLTWIDEAVIAIELYSLVMRYPYVSESEFFADVIGKRIVALSAAMPPREVTAAKERAARKNLRSTVVEWSIRIASGRYSESPKLLRDKTPPLAE